MRIKDFDNFRYPNRKPWLAVVLIVLAVFFIVQRYKERKTGEQKGTMESTTTATIPPTKAAVKAGIAARATPGGCRATARRDTTPRKRVVTKQQIPAERSIDTDQLLAVGKEFQAKGDLVEARTKYLEVLKRSDNFKVRSEVEQRLAGVNVELVMTPRAMPEKVDYVVQRGDSVDKIAKKFGVTAELIQKSNQLKNSDLIKAGDRLRVFTGKFAIRVSKARNDLYLYMNGEFFKRYRVGTGKYNKTPGGPFTVTEKIKEPVWWRPDGKEIPYGDKDNILGTRWMTLRATGDTPDVRGYGIHGTWDNNTVGKSVSAGCIRLMNSDVEELFTLVPMGTPVTITE